MRYLPALVWLWFCIIACPLTVFSSETGIERYRYSIQEWSEVSGFPADVVYDIKLSENGYLWFATSIGLIRYDGMRFVTFDTNSHEDISDNRFLALAKAGNDGILAINHNEIIRISAGKVSIQPIHNVMSRNSMTAVAETDQSYLIAIPGNGILVIDFEGNQSYIKLMQGLPSLNVTDLYRDSNGTIWIGTDKGVALYDNGAIERQLMFGDNHIQSISGDHEGNIWFGTLGMGAFLWGDNLLTQFTTGDGLSSNNITSIAVDDIGIVWLGTNEGTLNQLIGTMVAFTNASDGLPQGSLKHIVSDGRQTIWAGTERSGIVQLKKRKVSTLSRDNGLNSNLIQSIYEDKDNTVWIGTYSDGIIRIDGKGRTNFTIRNGLNNNRINSVFGDRVGRIWIATPSGLNWFQNGRINRVREMENIPVQSVYVDQSDDIWVGTQGNGLYKYEDGKFQKYITNTLLDKSIITTFHGHSNGDLWVGTGGSGFGVVMADTAWHFNGENQLDHNFIYSFLEDSDGILWIGTGSGLLRFDGEDFEVYTPALGLLNNEFFSLIEDNRRTIWSTSSNGIQYFSMDEMKALRNGSVNRISTGLLGVSEGLPTRQFNNNVFPSGWQTQSEQIWFPTMRGIVMVDPAFAVHDEKPVKAFIEQLKSSDKTFSRKENIILEPGTLSLEIDYTATEFYNPGNIQFRYRLLGFDETWTDAGTRRTAYYSGLKPGNYTFEVMAAHEGQSWTGLPGTMSFRISPYFYQSNWFIALLTLGLVFVGYTTIRLRLKTIREQELTKMVEARTQQLQKEIELHKKTEEQLEISLQEKIVLIKEMHHRVKNNLTLIYALFELQMSKIEDKKVSDILSDSQFRLKSMAMLHEQLYQNELLAFINFDEFLKQLANSIHHAIAPDGIEIVIPDENDKVSLDINQSVPAGLILNELITNACKHAFKGRKEGQVSVSLKYNHPKVTMSVEDDGVGLPGNIDLTTSGTLGLELVSTLAAQLNGDLKYINTNGSKFEIEFIKDD